MIPIELLKKGVEVLLKQDFGSGPAIKAVIKEVGEHKGQIVIDYAHNGWDRWAYVHQIVEILS